jgi:hypothetical protein
MAEATVDWTPWTALLAEVVTDVGKVDYAALIERRARLDAVVAELAAVGPDNHPERFPSDEHRLAYWLNAYNVFTLHAILAEYPITSVWKTRDGQFFQRRRHVAGGRAVSLDDIEHEVLRGEFAEPRIGPITFHEPVEHYNPGDTELRELHLYEGNFCNRTCSFCTINGSPDGWYEPYAPAVLEQALRSVAADGNVKFYGGEPTLHADAIIDAMAWLRAHGFRGLFTIFSNGIKADRLLAILDSDPRSEAVLNYSILHGRDAEPLPPHARERLEAWATAHPNRLFQGYKILFHAGAGAEGAFDRDREADFHGLGRGCVRCFPVLTSAGRFHACPFAAEVDAPHYDLGAVGSAPAEVLDNYRGFRRWIDDVLDPAARARGISSCEMCHRHLKEMPVYERDPVSQ